MCTGLVSDIDVIWLYSIMISLMNMIRILFCIIWDKSILIVCPISLILLNAITFLDTLGL